MGRSERDSVVREDNRNVVYSDGLPKNNRIKTKD